MKSVHEYRFNRKKFKLNTYIEILKMIATLAPAKRKQVACMALKKDFSRIASFGYNGSFKGAPLNPSTFSDDESLLEGQTGLIHAEINMVSKFREPDPENYVVLLTMSPCDYCTKVLINSNFKNIYWLEDYRETKHLDYFRLMKINHGNIFEKYDEVLNSFE